MSKGRVKTSRFKGVSKRGNRFVALEWDGHHGGRARYGGSFDSEIGAAAKAAAMRGDMRESERLVKEIAAGKLLAQRAEIDGPKRTFWLCTACAEETDGRPEKCVKCGGYSFETVTQSIKPKITEGWHKGNMEMEVRS